MPIDVDDNILASLLAAAVDRRGSPDEQVARLREVSRRYSAGNPFEVGDLVTPRPQTSLRRSGDVFIVLERMEPRWPSFSTNGPMSERRFDMRLAFVLPSGDVGILWGESVEFERWLRPSTEAAAPSSDAPL